MNSNNKNTNESIIKNAINKFSEILKSEYMTPFGRVNLLFVIIVVGFIILYNTGVSFCHAVSTVGDCVKVAILKEDIYHPYESPDAYKISSLLLGIIIPCLGYIAIDQWYKNFISNKTKK